MPPTDAVEAAPVPRPRPRPRSRPVVFAVALVVALGWVASPTAAQSEDRTVSARGDARFLGSTDDLDLAEPLVGAAATPSGEGYWLLAGDGGIFSYGDARFHGSTGDLTLNEPVVGIAADPQGRGYWTVAADGGVFAFDVDFHGSTGDLTLNRPIVAMAATATGDGYLLVADDGGTFAFGDARFAGSTGDRQLDAPVVDIAAHPDGDGYWLVGADGAVHAFGVPSLGSASDRLSRWDRATSIAAHPDGNGYWITSRAGEVHAFGSATSHRDRTGDDLETIALVPTSSGNGYWLVHVDPPAPEVVSSFTTSLVPGQPRNDNIQLAADYLDGSTIDPGERFSLNEAIGPRTRARGFGRNGFIAGDGEIISVVGGGVSQMGTTFVNAAVFAGIEIEEFRPHTIWFERYPMCREATLSWRTLDVVVVNDSPHRITVRTSHTDSSVTVSFVSRPWAEVESWIGEPFNTGAVGGPFSVRCGRTVTYPDGTTSSDTWSWRYHEGFPG